MLSSSAKLSALLFLAFVSLAAGVVDKDGYETTVVQLPDQIIETPEEVITTEEQPEVQEEIVNLPDQVEERQTTTDTATTVPGSTESSLPPRHRVAQLKMTSCRQSSTAWGGVCRRAIDGNTAQYWGKRSCTHTRKSMGWWRGYLSGPSRVTKVVIYNRLNARGNIYSSSNRLNNFVVTVDGKECGSYNSQHAFKVKTFHCNVVGHTVEVRSRKNTYLTLCEVQVFGEHMEKNANAEKLKMTRCSQSSTAWGGVCQRAIDGNTAQYWGKNSCTHTRKSMGWWRGFLSRPARVTKVVIYNRLNAQGNIYSSSNRLNNFVVTVDGKPCGSYNSRHAFKVKTFNCNVVGRQVEVRSRKNTYLTLCEVQVFGD